MASTGVDWPRFLRLVQFHRIEGLAWKTLSGVEMPDEIRAALSETAWGIAARNLQASAECRALLDRFDAAGVPLLFLKGLTLAALAYGDPAVKSAIDVDLLVDPSDLGRAADLLRQYGYRLIAPQSPPDDEGLRKWHRGWKESVWAKGSPPVQIDLHTRTADHPRLIPGIDVHSPRQWPEVGHGIRLPTLADDELFAYLVVHGASSAWFRLKWIADFAALLCGRSAAEMERLYRRSQQLGAHRAAGQALLLADSLFAVLQPFPALREEIAGDRTTRWLHRAALHLLTGEAREPSEGRWGTLTIHATQFLLLPGLAYKLSELWRQAARIMEHAG